MFKIVGKHSIQMADSNPNRKHKIFFGSQKTYRELQLQCEFRPHKDDFLQTRELYVEANMSDILSTKRIILLDCLEDPQNIGGIIRSAAAMGYSVILRRGKGCQINETVIKCASGGADCTPLIEICNLQDTINMIKKNGFWVYGLSENGTCDVRKNEKVMIVVGSEGFGMRSLTEKNCDFLFKIDGKDNFCVYNASVAAAIAMYGMKCQAWDSNP
jgi:23S rRNA (guanosine2251-2'-O)-methyltransferase